MSEMLDAALNYNDMGYSVIPVLSTVDNKKPLIKWKKYQDRKSTKEEITTWWKKWPSAMVGIVTGFNANLLVIDCDTEKAYEQVQEHISESMVLPIAKSPHGWHLYFQMPEDKKLTVGVNCIPGVDYRGEGGFIVAPPSINIHGERYQWLNGAKLEGTPPRVPTQVILNVLIKNNSLDGGVVREDEILCSKDEAFLKYPGRDTELWKLGMAMADGCVPRNKIRQVLNILAENCDPPFPEKEIPVKVNSIFDRLKRKERNLMDEVKEWVLLQKGYFFTSDIQQTLQITTKEEKKYLTVILVRLQQSGIIERYGERRGCYRLVEKEDNELVFLEENFLEHPIKLPFGLNDVVSIYPGNIIIIAGSKSAGKSAMLMNIAMANWDNHKVVYLNTEMQNEEWSKRWKNMGCVKKEDVKCIGKTIHGQNFHDNFDGSDNIFLLDYLEIHDNFFEIGKHIRKIHEKLVNGICVIAIQKKFGERLARGADFSMEKSRLYLSMDYGEDKDIGGHSKLTIVDAKIPKMPGGINGQWKRIKIFNGATLQAIDKTWRRH